MAYRYQLFISHGRSSADYAQQLAKELKDREIACFVDRANVKAGGSIVKAIDRALRESRHLLMLVSGPLSKWQSAEFEAFVMETDHDPRRTVIPVRLKKSEVPPLMGRNLAIDARKLTPAQLADYLGTQVIGPKRKSGNRRQTFADPILEYRARVVERHSRLVPFLPEMTNVLLEHACVELAIEGGRHGMSSLDGESPSREHLSLRKLIEQDLGRIGGSRFLIEGEPGAGKTTIARNLARVLAGDPKDPFPLFVSARRFAELDGNLEGSALDLMQTDSRNVPEKRRAKIREALLNAWLLIDGFDEVSGALRETAYRRIGELSESHAGPIVVLSRFIAFERRDPWPGFTRAKILALDEGRQQTLIEKLGGKQLVEPILAAAAANRRVADLARNPLLLSLLTIVGRESLERGSDVPSDDGRLMQEAIRLLLERGFALDPRKVKDVRAAREILGTMSLELHRRGGENWRLDELRSLLWDLLGGEVQDLFDAKRIGLQIGRVWKENDAFLDDIGFSGVIAPHDGIPDQWRYFHRSIREFLVAERIARLPNNRGRELFDQFTARARDPSSDSDGSWAEVYRYWLGITKAPLELHGRLALESADVASRTVRRSADLSESERLKLALDADKDDGVDLLGAALAHPEPDVAAELVLERAKPEIATEQAGRLLWTLERLGREPKDFFARIGRNPAPSGLIEFVEIPAGTFEMGADPKIDGDEEFMQRSKPLHRVSVARFALANTLVTRAQYRAFDAKHESKLWEQVPKDEVDRFPVTYLSWWEAYMFSRWIGGRLPSEAEWEYACRANTRQRMRYSFGDDEESLADRAWYFRNSGVKLLPLGTEWDRKKVEGEWAVRPHPVGLKPANPFGLFDMHGNAWEWCTDSWHENYEGAPTDGSPWLDPASPSRVHRGGSFRDSAVWLRSAIRSWLGAGYRWDSLGFRPARPLSP